MLRRVRGRRSAWQTCWVSHAPMIETQHVGATVDVGSNSVHLLVAGLAGHRLLPLLDESVFLGLGSAVAERGYLGAGSRAELTVTLAQYADVARSLGAESITFLGTEPIRRAADAPTIVQEVGMASGLALHVLSHEEEAYLMLIGVTEGIPATHQMLVVDIGGGSSEFCVVDPTQPALAAGLPLGSARLTDRFVRHDPPAPTEVAEMHAAARLIVADAPAARPDEIVAVAGTASNLLKILPEAALDGRLTRERLRAVQAILESESSATISERHLVKPMRARLLAAGGAIMDAIMERYGVDEVRVSEAGIREGAILAVDHGGFGWRDRLAELVLGWRA
jgi:exopolyphosphatase/guanosine-5'-triphosphate,3'-diphosphate pyrophosphatase